MANRMLPRLLVLLIAPLAIAGPAPAQTIANHGNLTAAELESILKLSKIDFTKFADAKAGGYFYDFKIGEFNLRLNYRAGDRLLLDTLFPAQKLEKANQWNLSGKFSRAAVGEDDKGASYAMLEAQLNLRGSVNGAAFQAFLDAFAKELSEFDSFIQAGQPRRDIAKEEDAFKDVMPVRLEKTLAELKIAFTKVPLKAGNFAYRYQSKETPIVLTNWGKDMMLEAKFAKLPMDKVNQYNLERKFVRAVAYKNKLGEYTGLEANLSFQGGITESILRNFIAVFDEDVREFGAYSNKATP